VSFTLAALTGTASDAAAQAWDCRWIGEGEALLCVSPQLGVATLSAWQGEAWVTVPASAGFGLPAALGGLSTFGRSYPPSPVTPAISAYSQSRLGNTLTQTGVLYGPGATSHPITCTTWYSGYAGATAYQTCR
jgi:hypothetical protein